MSEDQTAPEETQDTQVDQETETPAADTPESPAVDYKSRYESLLPEFTRKSQRLAELEQQYASGDDEYDYEDDEDYEDGDLFVDPYDDRLSRIENLLAQQHQQATLAQQQEAEVNFINREITVLEKERSEEFSDEEFDLLGHLAERTRDEAGRPDVQRAYEQFQGILDSRKQRWVSGKKSPQVASGPGAAEVPDLEDREARADYIDRMLSGE